MLLLMNLDNGCGWTVYVDLLMSNLWIYLYVMSEMIIMIYMMLVTIIVIYDAYDEYYGI
jgi:hypothetical protein